MLSLHYGTETTVMSWIINNVSRDKCGITENRRTRSSSQEQRKHNGEAQFIK